jgi:hypothetical protein
MSVEPIIQSRNLRLETGIKIFAVFDALIVLGLAWLVVSSDLFS